MANITDMSREPAGVQGTLRAIRSKLNLSQEKLAERLGVSFATVNRWEGGTNRPQKAALQAIAALAEEAAIDEEADNSQASAAGVTRRRRGRTTRTDPSTKPME